MFPTSVMKTKETLATAQRFVKVSRHEYCVCGEAT